MHPDNPITIFLNGGLATKQHLGNSPIDVYRTIVDRRIEAKRAGNKSVADSLKTAETLDGTSRQARQYASPTNDPPDLLSQVILMGQLHPILLTERLRSCWRPVW